MKRRNFLVSGILAGVGVSVSPAQSCPLPFSDNGRRLKPFYIPPSPGPMVEQPNGIDFRLKVRSHQTNNQYSCMEFLVGPKRMGPAPHVHKALDEIMFVQEGTVSVMVEDKVYEVEAGGWHMRPSGMVHTFWNASNKPARFIDMYVNQDFDNFLEKMFLELIPDFMKRGVSLTSKEATEKMDKLNARYGITMFEDQRQPIMDRYHLKG